MQNKHVLLPVVAFLTYNAWHVQDGHKRGESASYDGDERPVTETDVLMARALLVLVAAVFAYVLLFDD